jgi:NCAIR mutase (PurE)-related protein
MSSHVAFASPPKVMWLIIGMGAILASVIDVLLSLAFIATPTDMIGYTY